MKYIIRASWISYFIFFLVASLNNFRELVLPGAKLCGFYSSLIAFYRINIIWYICALMASILSIISLWPLYVRAFALPRSNFNFFKMILFLRIVADICGHRYETLFFKAISLDNHQPVMLVLIIAIMLNFPSYKALYDHAFNIEAKKIKKK